MISLIYYARNIHDLHKLKCVSIYPKQTWIIEVERIIGISHSPFIDPLRVPTRSIFIFCLVGKLYQAHLESRQNFRWTRQMPKLEFVQFFVKFGKSVVFIERSSRHSSVLSTLNVKFYRSRRLYLQRWHVSHLQLGLFNSPSCPTDSKHTSIAWEG